MEAQQNQHRPNTMNTDELNVLKVTKFKKKADVKEGEEEKCPICQTDFDNGDDVKVLPCEHIYHPGCVDTWLVRNCTCPICKKDVKKLMQDKGSSRRAAQSQVPARQSRV